MAIVVALTISLGAAACGSDDRSDAGADAAHAAEKRADAERKGTPEEQIRAVYDSFIASVYDKDVEGACDRLTPATRKKFGAGRTCEQQFDATLSRPIGKNRPFVVTVKVDGDRALAKVKTKTSRHYPIRFARLDGDWKISGGLGSP